MGKLHWNFRMLIFRERYIATKIRTGSLKMEKDRNKEFL